MPPLSQTKIETEKEKLLVDSNQIISQVQTQKVVPQSKSVNEQEVKKIMEG